LLKSSGDWENGLKENIKNFLSEDYGFIDGKDLHFTE